MKTDKELEIYLILITRHYPDCLKESHVYIKGEYAVPLHFRYKHSYILCILIVFRIILVIMVVNKGLYRIHAAASEVKYVNTKSKKAYPLPYRAEQYQGVIHIKEHNTSEHYNRLCSNEIVYPGIPEVQQDIGKQRHKDKHKAELD